MQVTRRCADVPMISLQFFSWKMLSGIGKDVMHKLTGHAFSAALAVHGGMPIDVHQTAYIKREHVCRWYWVSLLRGWMHVLIPLQKVMLP